MNKIQKISIVTLRFSIGWLIFYAGLSKILNPEWSASGFLQNAKTLAPLYNWLGSAGNIGWVNLLNEWGALAIGTALLAGFLIRPAAYAGIILMILYYVPVLEFPFIPPHALIVDEHIVYIFAFMVLAAFKAGNIWGLDALLKKN